MSKQTDKQPPVQLGKISSRLARYCFLIVVLAQLITIAVILVTLSQAAKFGWGGTFFMAVTAVITIETLTCIIIYSLLSDPLDILARALSSSMYESIRVYPPHAGQINGPVKEELRKAVDFIYARNDSHPPDNETLSSQARAGEAALRLIHSLPVGIIALDYNEQIIAYNDLAPIEHAGNQTRIQLDFTDNGMPLDKWYAKVKDASLSSSQTWTRIQNVSSGSIEPRHIYDVVASYKQHATSGANLIVVTIDRTSDYIKSEDNIDFVALATHELRGPVTVIKGYLEILADQMKGKISEEQQGLLDRINVSTSKLSSYINNVLNTSRYSQRNLGLKLSECKVSSIVNDIKDDLDLRATTVNRHITWSIKDNLPTIAADKSSIGEVITNLVDNAIKYSNNNGQIEVSAELSGKFVAISVTDHGIGIPSSVVEQLFTKFYRSHRSRASIGGTGIGLFISRAIVESHGGTISVDSTEGEGSIFTFTIPTYAYAKNMISKDGVMHLASAHYISNHGLVKK